MNVQHPLMDMMENPLMCHLDLSHWGQDEFVHQGMYTIRKVNFLSKNSILTKTQTFHEFFLHKIFFDNFSREIKVVNS